MKCPPFPVCRFFRLDNCPSRLWIHSLLPLQQEQNLTEECVLCTDAKEQEQQEENASFLGCFSLGGLCLNAGEASEILGSQRRLLSIDGTQNQGRQRPLQALLVELLFHVLHRTRSHERKSWAEARLKLPQRDFFSVEKGETGQNNPQLQRSETLKSAPDREFTYHEDHLWLLCSSNICKSRWSSK